MAVVEAIRRRTSPRESGRRAELTLFDLGTRRGLLDEQIEAPAPRESGAEIEAPEPLESGAEIEAPAPLERGDELSGPAGCDHVGGEPTLDDLIAGVWEGLTAQVTVACPICGGEMEPESGVDVRQPPGWGQAPRRVISGHCGSCGTALS